MRTKKNRTSNLERKKPVFLLLGFAIALLLIITAFEWTVFDKKPYKLHRGLKVNEEMELPDVTRNEKKNITSKTQQFRLP